MSLEESLDRIAEGLFAIAEALTPTVVTALPQPKPFTVRPISERRLNDMDLLTYEATLPTVPTGTDVASQVFSVTVDGVQQLPVQLLANDVMAATFEVPQGSSVDLSLIYVDDGGNNSPPRTQTFVAQDTIGPEQPGDFGEIRVVSERTVPDVP